MSRNPARGTSVDTLEVDVLRLRLRSIARILAKSLLALVVLILILIGLGISALETGWAKNEIRELIVRQANQFLTARLEIGRLEGSLFRGLQLGDIRLSRDGRTLVAIKDVQLSYSLRELLQQGTVIKRIAITGLEVAAAKEADGRWDLANLVRREARQEQQTGPGRPIEIVSIELKDATIALGDPVTFGAAHIPTRYEALNGSFSFKYVPVHWTLTMRDVSWRGSAPDLDMKRLSGGIDNGPEAIVFDDLTVETPRSQFTLTGRIDREKKEPTADDAGLDRPRGPLPVPGMGRRAQRSQESRGRGELRHHASRSPDPARHGSPPAVDRWRRSRHVRARHQGSWMAWRRHGHGQPHQSGAMDEQAGQALRHFRARHVQSGVRLRPALSARVVPLRGFRTPCSWATRATTCAPAARSPPTKR